MPPISSLDTFIGLLDCSPTVPHISHLLTMSEEEVSPTAEDPHAALIEAFIKALTSVKVSPTDALKPPEFDWNSHDQYEDFRLFQRGMES